LKLGLSTNKIAESKIKKVETALKKTLDVWIGGVELALAEFDKIDHLPRRILLCGGGSSLEKLVEALSSPEWRKELAFTKKPIVQHIDPSEVLGVIDTTGAVTDHTFITAMGLLRVGYDTIIGSGEGASIKEKFNRLLRI
jgi:cell division protein FtsA